MAFKKLITFADTGNSGEYIRLDYLSFDRAAGELTAHLNIYKERGMRSPVQGTKAKVRLSGAQFEALMARISSDGDLIMRHVYEQAKAGNVTFDQGPRAFSDAKDV
jgi:hypothetical protein